MIGFKNDDTMSCLTQLPSYACSATMTSDVGDYIIKPTGAEANNYKIDYQPGNLSVNKRNLSVKVGDYIRSYGLPNPDFEITYSGFVNEENLSSLSSPVEVICEASESSDVGVYPIILRGGNAKNYTFDTYTNGTLTIEKANQTINWTQDLSNINQYAQIELTATATSGLPVSYEMSPNNVATLYENNGDWYLDCYGMGAVNIRANQIGNNNYNPATVVTKTLVVSGSGYDPSSPQIFINVETPGTLSSLIASNRKYQIKNLRLAGKLNGTDIRYIREMAGVDYYGTRTAGVLEILDISDCTIVSGGNKYYGSYGTSNYQISDYMFHKCSSLTTIQLPNNSNNVGNYSLAECERLVSVTLPNNIMSIGTQAFSNDISLSRLALPKNLTTIGEKAFIGCSGLYELNIPENVRSIGKDIVYGCQNIEAINVSLENEYFASTEGVLYSASYDKLLIFPMDHNSTEYCIVDGVQRIDSHAFANAKKLKEIELPESLTSIEKDAFIGCPNIITVKVRAINPPICENDCFSDINKTRCELQVPIGCYSFYWVAPVWSEFNKIIETDFSGIEDVVYENITISAENGTITISGCPFDVEVRIYQMNGLLIFNQLVSEEYIQFSPHTSGTYIIQIGKKSYKVMLK